MAEGNGRIGVIIWWIVGSLAGLTAMAVMALGTTSYFEYCRMRDQQDRNTDRITILEQQQRSFQRDLEKLGKP